VVPFSDPLPLGPFPIREGIALSYRHLPTLVQVQVDTFLATIVPVRSTTRFVFFSASQGLGGGSRFISSAAFRTFFLAQESCRGPTAWSFSAHPGCFCFGDEARQNTPRHSFPAHFPLGAAGTQAVFSWCFFPLPVPSTSSP